MSSIEIPDFARLLGDTIRAVPEPSRPGFLARLERVAASRYRAWAAECAELAEGLLACAAREDEIADRVEKLSSVRPEDEEIVAEQLERARARYVQAFEGLTVRDQITLQAHAERQGSLAWKSFAAQADDEATQREYLALSKLEVASADHVDAALGIDSTAGR